jgi:hypothetical protein
MIISEEEAIWSLAPGAAYRSADGNRVWMDTVITEPSQVDIDAEVIRLQDIENYQEPRRFAYPSIGDQLDMIFHAGLGGDEFQAAIQAVKDANPKP